MSVFSDTLTRYIEHKNIKVFSLAKYCNLDRSTMYKIINGKRNPPSPEVFEKMTQFMHLTALICRGFLLPFHPFFVYFCLPSFPEKQSCPEAFSKC